MLKLSTILFAICLSILIATIRADDDEYDDYYDNDDKPQLDKRQLIALTRDWLGRSNPDEFFGFHAFFPVWAVVMMSISAFFFVLTIISGLCYVLGCKNPHRAELAQESNSKQRLDSLIQSKIVLNTK